MLEESKKHNISDLNKRKKINRIKTGIIVTILMLILIPTVLCIILGVRLRRLEQKVDDLISTNVSYEKLLGKNKNSGHYAFASESSNHDKSQNKSTSEDALEDKDNKSDSRYESDNVNKNKDNHNNEVSNIENQANKSTDNIEGNIKNRTNEGTDSIDSNISNQLDYITDIDSKTKDHNNIESNIKKQTDKSADNINSNSENQLDEYNNVHSKSEDANKDIDKTGTKSDNPWDLDKKNETIDKVNNDKNDNNKKDEKNDDNDKNIKNDNNDKNNKNEAKSDLIYQGKKVYLTFDDGPSKNTEKIMDILAEYDVKATFFVIGKTDEESKEIYQRIVEEGHTLGMHSYSHNYKEIYNSVEDFDKDFTKLWKLLYDTTGYIPNLYRFPGGSLNKVSQNKMEDFIRYLNEKGIIYYDWNVVNGDATGVEYTEEQMIDNVLSGVAKKTTSIVLMHDGQGKDKTVATLPTLLEALLSGGAEILPLDETVPLIQQIKAENVK